VKDSQRIIPCFEYRRVSSEPQNRISPDVQGEFNRKFAKKHGRKIVGTYTDTGSGWNKGKGGNRIDFKRMLKDMKRTKVSEIVTLDGSRLYRNDVDYVDLLKTDLDIVVHSSMSEKSEHITNPDFFEEIYVHDMERARNKRESFDKSKKVRASYQFLASQNRINHAPPGEYELVEIGKEDRFGKIRPVKRAFPIEDRAKFVLEAFQLASTCKYSKLQLGEIMRKKGMRSYRSWKDKEGVPISPDSLMYKLYNPFYAGYVRSRHAKKGVYKGDHEPLVSKALFDKVQKVMARQKYIHLGERGFVYRNGVFKCGSCNHGISAQAMCGGKYIYYFCTKSSDRSKKIHDRRVYWTEEEIDTVAKSTISEIQLDRKILKWGGELLLKQWELDNIHILEERTHLENEKKQLVARKNTFLDKLGGGIISDSDYQNKAMEIESRLLEIESKLSEIKTENKNKSKEKFETLVNLQTILNQCVTDENMEKRANLLKIVTEKIDLVDKKTLSKRIYWSFPFDELYNLGRETDFTKKKDRVAGLFSK
jgi:hypothetical protein